MDMGRLKSFCLLIACVAVVTLAIFFLCYNNFIKMKTGNVSVEYSLDDIRLENITRTGETLIVGEDPQMILESVNQYVDRIHLNGLKTAEEIQVFFCEGEEYFSEEKSIRMIPELTERGAILTLGKEVSKLRIDFNGVLGSTYTVSAIVLNPVEYVEWGFDTVVLCIIIGLLVGSCLLFLLREGKNFRIYLQALKKYRYLLEDMVLRDIKLKYRRSVIGFLWSVLNPLLMMAVITAVFRNLFRFSVENFAVYYLTGWVVFNFVTEATSGAMTSILGASPLIRKVYIPKYIFPIQKCVFSFVNMGFSLVALFVVMLVLGTRVTWYALLSPLPLILAFVFSVGLGMVLATAAVFFRDVIHLYGVFTMAWMYLTPIIYPEEILTGVMRTVMKLNPMYYYVDYFRKLTLYRTLPGINELVIMLFCSVVVLLLGMAVFKKKQDRFILFI